MPIEDFLLLKNEHKNQIKTAKAEVIRSSKVEEEPSFKPQTITFKHKLEQHLQGSGDRALDLNSKVQKG